MKFKQISSELNNKLSAYSALGLSLAAGNAEAQVVYTDVDPDFIISEPLDPPYDDQLSIDINADGSPEGTFVFSSFAFDGDCYSAGSMSFYFINFAEVLLDSAGSGIQVVEEGATIGSAGNWDDFIFQPLMYSDFFIDLCDTDEEFPTISGNWQDILGKYMGIRFFDAASELHYGYVRLTVLIDSVAGDAEVEEIRISGFAWEQTANTPITAGDSYVPDFIQNQYPTLFSLYPNPASSTLFLNAQNFQSHNMEWVLYDISGKQWIAVSQLQPGEGINVQHLPPGLYLVQLRENGKVLAVEKFIKQ